MSNLIYIFNYYVRRLHGVPCQGYPLTPLQTKDRISMNGRLARETSNNCAYENEARKTIADLSHV